jgi:type VI secretion system protein ImpA
MTEAQLMQAVRTAVERNDAAGLAAIPEALDHCRAIQVLAVERMGSVDAPDLQTTRTLLETLARLVVSPKQAGDGSSETAVVANDSAGGASLGVVQSRQDALRALDAVCEFLARSEPSNPAPLLIRRAQRLIGSGFMDIMRDMAPDSIAQIEAIAGIKPAES